MNLLLDPSASAPDHEVARPELVLGGVAPGSLVTAGCEAGCGDTGSAATRRRYGALRRTSVGRGTTLFIATTLLAAACGDRAGDRSPAETGAKRSGVAPSAIPAGMGSGAADGVFPRDVVHFGGSTKIPVAPERVVVIATGQLDATLTLGLVPVGAAAGSGADIVPGYLKREFPKQGAALAQIAPVGLRTEPNLEAIAALRPQLILGNKAGSGAIYDKLSAIAPTVLTEGTGVNWKQDFLLLADALGRLGQAESFLEAFARDAARLGEELASRRPAVSMVRFNPGRTRMFGIASFTGSIAADASLARPPSQQFHETSQDLGEEQVPLIDADWIFYSIQASAEATDAAKILAAPIWGSLNAVKKKQAVQVEDDPWYLNAGPTAARVVLRDLRHHLVG